VEMNFFPNIKLIPQSSRFSEGLLSLLVDFTTDSSVYLRALCLSALCSLLHNCQKVGIAFSLYTQVLTLKVCSIRSERCSRKGEVFRYRGEREREGGFQGTAYLP